MLETVHQSEIMHEKKLAYLMAILPHIIFHRLIHINQIIKAASFGRFNLLPVEWSALQGIHCLRPALGARLLDFGKGQSSGNLLTGLHGRSTGLVGW